MAIDLRCYSFIDNLQPQTASFLGTVSQGFLPVEEQAALIVEIAPGIEINRVTDIALKQTGVRPGMQIVERAYGMLEVHSFDQAEAQRRAGDLDRWKPRRPTDQAQDREPADHYSIAHHHAHQSHAARNMILQGQTLYILEVHPAGYAVIATNEAEKARPVNVLEFRAFGASGRVWLGGGEAEIEQAARAVNAALEAINGRPNTEGEKNK